jgi:hypothetical protein
MASPATSQPEFTEADDRFHFDRLSDRWWETETCWFSFCKPERRLGGWLYTMVRPNIGTVAGGAWIWDDTAHLPWEALYSTNYTALRLPEEADLTDIVLPTGVTIRRLEALERYRLGYQDGERLKLELEFEAVMAPRPLRRVGSVFKQASHFDQFGRVTGEILLNGERISIDCLAMRDRSWGPRAEHRPSKNAYVTGIASPKDAFLAVTRWEGGVERIAYGFMIKDGEIADLVGGLRRVERDRAHGWVTRIVIEAEDERGRRLEAVGERISSMIISRHSFIDSNVLLAWSINGRAGHGEDQDMWPVHEWADFRREARAAGQGRAA